MATQTHLTLTAPDISCGHCVNAIETAVGALPGVERVSADETTKVVTIDFDPSQVQQAAIVAAMTDEGYPPQA